MTNRNGKYQFLAAIIGAGAVVTIGALSATVTAPTDHTDLAKSTTMSIGATSTETTPPTAPAVAVAKPVMKGPAPLPSVEEAAK
ncbi:hypothetical protein MARA_56360 [Mycolicibacterium arabiense]|uniref:Uncharacterized protein n=1 Tax=Mycolicibacterium arabiense TaxID=1286181 RepID=A0A7I7S5R6_9MYCO|nr:hypothetical protein [Mycolicibacterium arabiense]MCV7372658.1 hypothetical protein [Mycolicibacterium arabiense]BBY52168.1 hypothetical protein MARA_56360 [Mycolicibacterium arabiense]